MEKTKKKGFAGLLICFAISLFLILYGSFIPYRGIGSVMLTPPQSEFGVCFSVYKFLLGAVFAAGIFMIGRLSHKKAIVIPFSILNMLIALSAFLPIRRYYTNIGFIGWIMRRSIGAGIVCLLPYIFYALIAVFALLTMIAAVKRNRRQPKALCVMILAAMGVYALVSMAMLLFRDPYMSGRIDFGGLRYLQMLFRRLFHSRITPDLLLRPFQGTAHIHFPFVTIAVLLAMFFAARSIRPIEAPVQASNRPKRAAPQGYSGKSKVAAAVLAGVIGNLGVHRFYLGRAGSAVVQLLGGISAIIGYAISIIEGYAYRPNITVLVIALVLLLFGCATGIWAFVDFIRILCNRLKPASGEFGNAPQASAAPPEYFAPQPVFTAPQQPVSPAPSGEAMQEDKLSQLDDMLAKGLLSAEEYDDIRRRINDH